MLNLESLQSCHCCGLVQKLPESKKNHEICCFRCHTRLDLHNATLNLARSRAAALGALILFPLAIFLPALKIEKFGHLHESSILSGMSDLFSEGHFVLGAIILICSIILPLAKLTGIFILGSNRFQTQHKHRAKTYRLIEWSGRWGMIDVLLIAALVAFVKLGDLVTMYPGPGALAFAACVIFSLIASSLFDPHAMWKEKL
jgi:uncharacterized paraquat-inducible protein A